MIESIKLTETFKNKLYLDFLKLGGNCLIVLKYKRKKSIYQMQITNYIFGLKKSAFIASISNECLKVLKLLTSVPFVKYTNNLKNFLKILFVFSFSKSYINFKKLSNCEYKTKS